MFKTIKSLFGKPSLNSVIENELDMSKRSLLTHQTMTTYNQKMVEYYMENIKRLTKASN